MMEWLMVNNKTPLTYDIPKYDDAKSLHVELSKIGKLCHDKAIVISNKLNYRSIGKRRTKIREELEKELQHIDTIVLKLS